MLSVLRCLILPPLRSEIIPQLKVVRFGLRNFKISLSLIQLFKQIKQLTKEAIFIYLIKTQESLLFKTPVLYKHRERLFIKQAVI